jgi:putative membrane protein
MRGDRTILSFTGGENDVYISPSQRLPDSTLFYWEIDMQEFITYMVKGLVIGSSMLIPGVSGGTMAITLGIYDQLIKMVNEMTNRRYKKLPLLLLFVAGAGIGMLLFARPILFFSEVVHRPTMYFFIGAVAGGIPFMFSKANEGEKMKVSSLIYLVIGAAIVFVLDILPENLFAIGGNRGIFAVFLLFIAGIIIAVALVLPGISASYMLLMLGMYDITMNAIKNFDLSYIIPLVIGGCTGIILTTKTLEKAMKNHAKVTYLMILGFMAASVIKVFPGLPHGTEIILCPILFMVGYTLIYRLSRREEQKG